MAAPRPPFSGSPFFLFRLSYTLALSLFHSFSLSPYPHPSPSPVPSQTERKHTNPRLQLFHRRFSSTDRHGSLPTHHGIQCHNSHTRFSFSSTLHASFQFVFCIFCPFPCLWPRHPPYPRPQLRETDVTQFQSTVGRHTRPRVEGLTHRHT